MACQWGYAVDFERYPRLLELVALMSSQDGYPQAELEAILTAAVIDPAVIRAISRPSEALPWHRYRRLFINDARVRDGVAFWRLHEAALERARVAFGVSPAVVVALLGVETHYGARLGSTRTLDALVTLTADYPRRSAFFSQELRAFLNTARAENIAPESISGSYAGAVGIPQFMPTSYQAYAVDFNGNGRRDLIGEAEDAIGSVGNYLKKHGWVAEQPIALEIKAPLAEAAAALVSKRAKPTLMAAQLAAAGVVLPEDAAPLPGGKLALLRLQEASGPRHIIGFKNFYAITRYNPSVNYAMAVTELARRIGRQRAQ